MQETWVQSLSGEDPLEKGMETYSSIIAWRIPCTEESGGLQSMGSQTVGHNGSDSPNMVIFNLKISLHSPFLFAL